jgi:hypothetical protein
MIVARSSGFRRGPLVERGRRGRVRLPAVLDERPERLPSAAGVVEDEDVLQLRAGRLGLDELRRLLGRRGERHRRAAVPHDVLRLVGHHRREDGDENRPVALAGEVDRRPLGRFSERRTTAPPSGTPRVPSAAETAFTRSVNSAVEIGTQRPSFLYRRRSGFGLAPRLRNTSTRVRGVVISPSPARPCCVAAL